MKKMIYTAAVLLAASCIVHAQVKPATPFSTNAVLPVADSVCRISARCDRVGGKVDISLGQAKLTLTGDDCPVQGKDYAMTKIPKETELKDGALAVFFKGIPRFAYYIRPNIRFYAGEDFKTAIKSWDRHPPASEHVFSLELRRNAEHVEWWLDGRYLTRSTVADEEAKVTAVLSGGAELKQFDVQAQVLDPHARLQPIALHDYRGHGGDTVLEHVEITEAATLKQYRLDGFDAAAKLDVGLSRWLGQSIDSGRYYDSFYMRGAFDGIPESLILRVPKKAYTLVWLLCAVDPAASPWMTVRIGRYREAWDGSGMSFGDTQVKVDPADPVGLDSIRAVGHASLRGVKGATEVPLYLVGVPLATDKVADYLQWEGLPNGQDWGAQLDWFNLEFIRQIETRVKINMSIFDAKPLGPQSGVQILGVTLQREPVHVLVRSEEEGFSFYRDQKPRLLLETHNETAELQTVKMNARLTDFDGHEHVRSLNYKAAPGVTTNVWHIDDLPLGWYDTQLVFDGKTKDGAWSYPASLSFALLPPDTRKAGAESPFGAWWFQGSHYTEPDPARVLPLFKKMGFRHAAPRIKGDPMLFDRYQVTPSMMNYMSKLTPSDTTLAENFMTNWPTVKTAMIFHETGIRELSTAIPYELTDAPPQVLSDEGRESFNALRSLAESYSTAIRKLDPEMKIMLGNGFTAFNTLWFREKLPKNLWDYCGLEMAVQLTHPESQPTGFNLQSFWIARQMADFYGYTNFPISSSFEVDYRPTAPGGLSLKRQANWYTRDVLHMLAWRSPHINVALIADVNASYYTSRWGSTGVFNRSPLHLPKPSFVSLATLTRMLDGAHYVRAVPTGSTGTYCLEFERGRDRVYAIWCSRGERPMQVKLNARLRAAVDSMGRDLEPKVRRGKVTVQASESPLYLVTRDPIGAIALGESLHPAPALDDTQVVDTLSVADAWRIAEGDDETFATYCHYWPMVRGNIVAQMPGPAAEGERAGLSLTLNPQPEVKDIVARYAVLEPTQGPRPITGEPDTLGVWVKGNSGWGRIYFEFTDANGHRWISNRNEGQSWDLSDWEAESSINHDGWRFVSLSLPECYPSGYYKPDMRHWICRDKETADQHAPPAYPIALSRIYVLLREKLVYVTDMTAPASNAIEIRDLTVGKRSQE